MLPTQAVESARIASHASSLSVGQIIFRFFLYLFVFLLLANVVYTALETKDASKTIYTVGEHLLYPSLTISDISKQAIAQKGLYVPSNDFFKSLFDVLKNYGLLFICFFTIYLWISGTMWLISRMPSGNETKKFVNFFISLIIFLGLQSMILIAQAAINKEIDSFRQFLEIMVVPVTCYIDFFQALQYLLKPAAETYQQITNQSLITP